MSRAEYAELRDLCADVEKAAEGKPYSVLGVGTSSAGIVAMFRALDRNSAYHMPLTNFQYGEDELPPLEEKYIPKLFAHFERWLPSDKSMEGKRLLIADFAGSGASMRALDKYLRRYLQESGRKLEFRFVAVNLGTPPNLPPGTFPVTAHTEWMRSLFVSSQWNRYAPRRSYDVRKHDQPEPGEGRFGDFVEDLKGKIAADPAMKSAKELNRHFPSNYCADVLKM